MRHPRGRGSAGEPELGTGLRAVLWLAAFAAGFAVTGLEVALGRLLAPHFGASLTVWASVIAAVVAALALGYPLGGILADRHPGPGLPLGALLLGGLLGALLGVAAPPWLRASMQGIALSGPAYSLRLAGALALFGLPCLLLASVAPAVLRVTLRERATAGRDAGVLFALGSLGSVLGVLLSALWWIPMLGLRATFLLLAAVAMAPPLFAMLSGLARVGAVTRAAALILLAAFPLLPEAVVSDDSGRLLHDADSGLQHIRVLARDTPEHRRRWLMLDEGWTAHSALLEPSLATGEVWDWMALSALLPRSQDGRTDVLIVGLAGGTVSNLMTRYLAPLLPDLAIVGVEIDPQVIEVADRHLGLDRSRLETVVADGRVWLRASNRRFDLILLDAYHQPSIPAHLATREFFEEVRDHLAPGGLAVLNVFAPAQRSALLAGLAATFRSVFADPWQFQGPARDGFASRLLFGGPALPLDLAAVEAHRIPAPLRPAWRLLERHTAPLAPPSLARVWTDDWSPVERITDQVYRATRPAAPPSAG